MHAGMYGTIHIVAAVDIVDVHLIRVLPARRQRTSHDEPIAAVLEPRTSFNDHRPDDDEAVLTTEMLMPVCV